MAESNEVLSFHTNCFKSFVLRGVKKRWLDFKNYVKVHIKKEIHKNYAKVCIRKKICNVTYYIIPCGTQPRKTKETNHYAERHILQPGRGNV